jgi:hypothetical protein
MSANDIETFVANKSIANLVPPATYKQNLIYTKL